MTVKIQIAIMGIWERLTYTAKKYVRRIIFKALGQLS